MLLENYLRKIIWIGKSNNNLINNLNGLLDDF